MDVLAELLPPAYLVKAENTAKDTKQKAKYIQQEAEQNLSDSEEMESATASHKLGDLDGWDQAERRSGKDRREQGKCRGRWLESRAEKDRRQLSKAIEIKI